VTHRVFLDANVLFSAAWLEDSGLARLWRVPGATLITSRYAWAEAERNLETDEQRSRLSALATSVQLGSKRSRAPVSATTSGPHFALWRNPVDRLS
jgi:predicted nucleic acid-binding protein